MCRHCLEAGTVYKVLYTYPLPRRTYETDGACVYMASVDLEANVSPLVHGNRALVAGLPHLSPPCCTELASHEMTMPLTHTIELQVEGSQLVLAPEASHVVTSQQEKLILSPKPKFHDNAKA